MWLHHRVKEIASMSRKLNVFGTLPARAIQQWSHIMDRLAAGKGLVAVVRKIPPQWSMNVDAVVSHTPGQNADTVVGIVAVALHDATVWK